MKIDYVILSADDSYYLDFYKPISKLWNHFGIKTLMLHISNEETDFKSNEFGLYKKIKSLSSYPTSWQAQLIRIYAYKYFENESLLISDIDMMPLNGDFFIKNAEILCSKEVLNYSGQPYSDVPYFPMCYILGQSKTMNEVLQTENNFEQFLHKIKIKYSVKWNTDENFLYDQLHQYANLKQLNKRYYNIDRIDRSNWKYDPNLVKNKKYIDCHTLKPYKQNQIEIDKLISIILNKNE